MTFVTTLLDEIGLQLIFFGEIFKTGLRCPCSFESVCDQIYRVTKQSFSTVAMSGFFVGALLVIQFTVQITQFGALGYLGGLTTSSTLREIGPLLIAFMLSGKVGAYTAAELGTMRVTEQIDAIRCLGAGAVWATVLLSISLKTW